MDWGFFLKSAWLFIVGVAVAVFGVYTLFAFPAMGSGSFVLMLVGLFFTGTGSIYGKRKLRGDYYMMSEEQNLESLKKEKPKATSETAEPEEMEEFLEEAEQAEEQRVEAPEDETPKPSETAQKPAEEEHIKIVKVIICPKCGAENEERDIYCYRCGKKLRLKGFPREKKGNQKTSKK